MQKRILGLNAIHFAALVGLLVLGCVVVGGLAVWLFVFGGGPASNTVEVVTATFPAVGTLSSQAASVPSPAAPSGAAAAQPLTGSGSQSLLGRWTLLPPPTPSGPAPTPIVINVPQMPWPTATPPPGMTPAPPKASPTPIAPMVIDVCAIAFGNSLEFFPDGTYAGTAGAWLPGGAYSVQPGGRVKLATAKDGISVFPFSIDGDLLTVRATGATLQCTLRYRRVP